MGQVRVETRESFAGEVVAVFIDVEFEKGIKQEIEGIVERRLLRPTLGLVGRKEGRLGAQRGRGHISNSQ
jgi:hypothetical protein